MPSRKTSVLVVDDDIRIIRMLQRMLELEGYRVLTATNGEAALNVFDKETPELVLLDIMMPDVDGFTLCQRIREFSQTPIIMVTAKGNEEEKVQGLNAGADDYVTKPFSASELVARVRAVLRRTKLWDEHPEPPLRFHDLVVDFTRHKVTSNNQEINLTATEYRLLSYLVHNAGRVVTTDQILEKVWGEDYIGEHHLLQVNVARLRQKLGDDPRNPRHILTRPGISQIYFLVRKRRISLVLLDLRLPEHDGWSVLQRMKSEPRLSTIPVIVFTASAGVSQRDKALSMGATDYLVKPLSAAALKNAIARIL